jgi:hypothetical protein
VVQKINYIVSENLMNYSLRGADVVEKNFFKSCKICVIVAVMCFLVWSSTL